MFINNVKNFFTKTTRIYSCKTLFGLNKHSFFLLYTSGLLNKNKQLLTDFLVQGPGYTKRPLGHRVVYPT